MKPGVLRTFGLGVVVAAGLGAMTAIPADAGQTFESLQGGFVLVASDSTRSMSDFPQVEVITPVPSTFDSAVQSEVFVFCEAEVSKENKAVKQFKGSFKVELYLLDRGSGKFKMVEVGSGKMKGDADGYGSFHVAVSMVPFAGSLEPGNRSAWFRTHGNFASKKGDSAALLCFASTT